jgi:hypothetical protein
MQSAYDSINNAAAGSVAATRDMLFPIEYQDRSRFALTDQSQRHRQRPEV